MHHHHHTHHLESDTHACDHHHSHAPKDFGKAFAIGIVLNIGFVIIEAAYGVWSNSLALLADAGHNLGDVLGLLLAWAATVLARRVPSQRFTYGLRSTSILATLTNSILLLVVTGGIAWEAISRFSQPNPVPGFTLIVIAAIGIVVNGATALLFMSGRKDDMNIRGAFLHMAADAAVSLGVVVAGVIIIFTGWQWLDPVVSLVIAVVIVVSTWGLLRDSIKLSLHAVPSNVEMAQVQGYLKTIAGVTEVHDLHVWGMSTTETALTVHLVMPTGHPGDREMAGISQQLHERFNIGHATIQIETGDTAEPCRLAPDHVV